MAITESDREAAISAILPAAVNGNIRPTDVIPTDFPESTNFPQLISQDPNKFTIFNLLMRQLLSNDKSIRADLTTIGGLINDNSSLIYLQRSTTYAVGNVRFHKLLPIDHYLVCTTAGKTADVEPESVASTADASITDGGSVWIIREIMTTSKMVISSTQPAEMKPGTNWVQIVSEEDE